VAEFNVFRWHSIIDRNFSRNRAQKNEKRNILLSSVNLRWPIYLLLLKTENIRIRQASRKPIIHPCTLPD
jgi:hypothetical protein